MVAGHNKVVRLGVVVTPGGKVIVALGGSAVRLYLHPPDLWGDMHSHKGSVQIFGLLASVVDPDPGSGMGKYQDPGSGINIPDPQH